MSEQDKSACLSPVDAVDAGVQAMEVSPGEPEEEEVTDFNVVMGSPAEVRERDDHIKLLQGMTAEEAKGAVMLLNVCHAAERVRGGIDELSVVINGEDVEVSLPWFKPTLMTENDVDVLRASVRDGDKVFGLYVGSTERLQYGESTVLDDNGGEWSLISHDSLRLRSGVIRGCGFPVGELGSERSFTTPLWTLYAILEALWMRLGLLFDCQVPVNELTPHSETSVFDISVLTRALLELVAFASAGGATVFSAKSELFNITGFNVKIAEDGATVDLSPKDGLENDSFTAWYCRFLTQRLKAVSVPNINQEFDTEEINEMAEIDATTSLAERLRRLLVVYQSSGDDMFWRAVQAAIIYEYLKSDDGVKLAEAVCNELPSTGQSFFLAAMEEYEEELEVVLPGVDVMQLTTDGEARSLVGVMHLANYVFPSLERQCRMNRMSFGPGRGIELNMPQESRMRVKIGGVRFSLLCTAGGLVAEGDDVVSRLIRVLNNLPDVSVLVAGIGRPSIRRPTVSVTWLVNLVIAGKAGPDKAIWVLRLIYNGLLKVHEDSSRASYIPARFKSADGVYLEAFLSRRAAVKLSYILDKDDVYLVKDHESKAAIRLCRMSPSWIEGTEVSLDRRMISKRQYRSGALLSNCKLG